ncbi:MAG: nucleotide exchange factor GrpE [Eubacterium sp.]|nr:nucleotide exchange factor GrpE [Eubacterium sp.]
MTAEELKNKVQAGEDPSTEGTPPEESEDVTITGEDMQEDATDGESSVEKKEDPEGGDADGSDTESTGGDKAEGQTADGADKTDADVSADDGADEKSSKGKRKKKKEKKDPRDDTIAELNDRLLRNLAEFENFRNRSEKEKEARFDMGARSVVEKILPVVDNLERGLGGLTDEEKESPFAKGIEAVYKQLMTAFTEMGVTPIEAVGQEFNPDLHQAVMHEEDDSDVTNQVVEELQKGYKYKDTVVRYSMVKVLN